MSSPTSCHYCKKTLSAEESHLELSCETGHHTLHVHHRCWDKHEERCMDRFRKINPEKVDPRNVHNWTSGCFVCNGDTGTMTGKFKKAKGKAYGIVHTRVVEATAPKRTSTGSGATSGGGGASLSRSGDNTSPRVCAGVGVEGYCQRTALVEGTGRCQKCLAAHTTQEAKAKACERRAHEKTTAKDKTKADF